MDRLERLVPIITIIALVAIAGCSSVPFIEGKDANSGGVLYTEVVKEPPENATVVQSLKDELKDSTLLQRTLDEAVANGSSSKTLNEKQVQGLEETLNEAPYYNGESGFGYYIRHEGAIVHVRLAYNG